MSGVALAPKKLLLEALAALLEEKGEQAARLFAERHGLHAHLEALEAAERGPQALVVYLKEKGARGVDVLRDLEEAGVLRTDVGLLAWAAGGSAEEEARRLGYRLPAIPRPSGVDLSRGVKAAALLALLAELRKGKWVEPRELIRAAREAGLTGRSLGAIYAIAAVEEATVGNLSEAVDYIKKAVGLGYSPAEVASILGESTRYSWVHCFVETG